jgi:hypothetical protein
MHVFQKKLQIQVKGSGTVIPEAAQWYPLTGASMGQLSHHTWDLYKGLYSSTHSGTQMGFV